jgi:hypothetical protein
MSTFDSLSTCDSYVDLLKNVAKEGLLCLIYRMDLPYLTPRGMSRQFFSADGMSA